MHCQILRGSYHHTWHVPKDFGAVVLRKRELLPPYDLEEEVALEVFRLAPQRVTRIALLDTGYQPRPLRRRHSSYSQ